MKKTIVVLLALSGLAMGESIALVNIMQTGNSTQGSASVDVWGDSYLSLVDAKAEVSITGVNNAKEAFSTAYANSIFAVNGTNVGGGGTFTYTLTFTTDFADGVAAITLDSLTFDMFTLNGSGKTQNSLTAKNIRYDYTLATPEESLRSGSDIEIALGGGYQTSAQGGTAAYSYDDATDVYTRGVYGTEKEEGMSDADLFSGGEVKIAFDEVELMDETTYTLSLDVERVASDGYYLGFGNVSLNGTASVPEPTTATLSLLALAGLAARRRRK